jgi:hypothetical protein
MSNFQLGCFVTHQKLPELGAGEVVASEKGALRIRFAGGERSFSEEIAQHHLTVTIEGPPPVAAKKAARRKAAPKKAAAAKTPS